jgi:hypothetical protein
MWEWWTGKKEQDQQEPDGHTRRNRAVASAVSGADPAHTDAAARTPTEDNPATAATNSTALVPAGAPASQSVALVPTGGSGGDSNAAAGAVTPSSAPPTPDGFWGYTAPTFSASNDPALDDMLNFYAFSHHRDSEYSGAVCFRLKYPEGDTSVRVVEVLPRGQTNEEQQRLRDEEEKQAQEERDNEEKAKLVPRRPAARVRLHLRRSDAAPTQLLLEAGSNCAPADTTSADASAAEAVARHLSWMLPSPCVTLIIRTRDFASADALVPAASSLGAIAESAAVPVPSIPSSPRIRIYRDEVPSHVSLSCTLSCPRDVFFDVYMGRLDPIRAVLSGKAHCSGYKYMRLLHFGQAFDLRSERWVEFYAAQEEVAKQRAKLLGAGGSSGGSGTGGGGQLLLGSGTNSSDSNSRNHGTSSSRVAHDGGSSTALFASSAAAPLAQLSFDAPLPALVGLVGLAHERFADVASRYATALRRRPFDFFSYATAAAVPSPFAAPRSDFTPQSPPAAMVGLRQQCSTAVAQLLIARGSSVAVSSFMPLHSQLQPPQPQHPSRQPQPQPQSESASSVLRSMLQRARQVHASTRIVFACDDFD